MPTQLLHRGSPSMLARETAAHPARFSRVLPLHTRRVPLLYTALAFACGVAAAQCWRPAALLVVASAALLVITAIALCRAPRPAWPAMLLTWVSLGWTLGTLHPRPLPDQALLPYADGLRREITATVIALKPLPNRAAPTDTDPQRWSEQAADQEADGGEQAFSADLRLQQIEVSDPDVSRMAPVTGTARVVLSAADAAMLHCGSLVHATVRLHTPREFRDPGVWSYTSWLAEHDITATGTIVAKHLQTAGNESGTLACRLQQAQMWSAERLQHFAAWQQRLHLPKAVRWNHADVAAWSAMLFGDRTELTHSLRAGFEQTGTFHLFVVSGLHIGVVAALVLWITRRLRMHGLLAASITAAITSAYALLTGFGAPVQRALLMTVVFLFARALSRERNAMNAVGAAILVMLLLRPQELFESSFQMTVLIALTIAGIAVPLLERTVAPYTRACRQLKLVRLDRRLPPHIAQFRVMLRWCTGEVAKMYGRFPSWLLHTSVHALLFLLSATVIGVVTELTMSLPMAVYFHRFAWIALPTNLSVMPLLLPLMICGILSFALCLIAYPLALAASIPAALLLHSATSLVRAFAAASIDLRTPGPSLVTACLLAGCVALSIVLLRSAHRAWAWAGVACACAVAAGTVILAKHAAVPQALTVAAIDVGQGDAILLTAPDGTAMLIDAGGIVGSEQDVRSLSRNSFDIGEEVVSPYLWQRGLRRLDVLALTHAHMDHLGGMPAVLRNFRPRELWLSVDVPSTHLHALLDQARSQGTAVRYLHSGTQRNWHGIAIDALAPQANYRAGGEPENDDSLVLRAGYGNASALLAGDAEQPSEEAMLASHMLSPVTLLKVGHHGSLTSTGEPLLQALHPKIAVISCGRGNHFGHPRMPILERLQQQHVATSRTDIMGAVEYTLHADGRADTFVPPYLP